MMRQMTTGSKQKKHVRRARKQKLTNRRLAVETLDERTMMAANIFYDDGVVTINGSNGADQASVTQLSTSDSFVLAVDANPHPWQNPENQLDVNNDGFV